jgi:hypothetical protein
MLLKPHLVTYDHILFLKLLSVRLDRVSYWGKRASGVGESFMPKRCSCQCSSASGASLAKDFDIALASRDRG